MFRHPFHREGANELRIVPQVVGDSHIFDGRIVSSGQNFEEVEVLRIAGHRVARVLERAQLHLGFQGVRRELAAVAGVLKIGALAAQIIEVPEGDEGPEQFCEGSSHRDVVGGGCWRLECASWDRRRRGCGPTGGSSDSFRTGPSPG